jgi:hypothetical protein
VNVDPSRRLDNGGHTTMRIHPNRMTPVHRRPA